MKDLIERVGDQGRWDRFEQISLHKWSAGRARCWAMRRMPRQISARAAWQERSTRWRQPSWVAEARTVEEGLAAWEEGTAADRLYPARLLLVWPDQ